MTDGAEGFSRIDSEIDPFDLTVQLLRARGVRSKIVTGGGRWSVHKPRYSEPSFCLMLEGTCWFVPDGAGAIALSEGDFLLLPQTPSFVLASELGVTAIEEPLTTDHDVHYGNRDYTMRMLGGYFRFDRANAELVVRLLPSMILIRRGGPHSSRLSRIVELIAEEAGERNRCRDLILERLVEVLLIEAWRFEATHAPVAERGLLGGLADPDLARVLGELHASIAEPWTVAELARQAGMSRAVFAERFTRKVGMPPMQYVTEWRIARAKELLLGDRLSLAAIASRIGYSSPSALSAAFTRVVGCSPAEFRQARCASSADAGSRRL